MPHKRISFAIIMAISIPAFSQPQDAPQKSLERRGPEAVAPTPLVIRDDGAIVTEFRRQSSVTDATLDRLIARSSPISKTIALVAG